MHVHTMFVPNHMSIRCWYVTTHPHGSASPEGQHRHLRPPRIRRLAASLSSRRPEFAPRSVCYGICVDKVHRDRFSSELLGFPLSISLHRDSPHSYITWEIKNSSLVAAVQRHSLNNNIDNFTAVKTSNTIQAMTL
jgi:hypothetical protein